MRTIEHTWIPMPDGTRLAARIWLPEDAEAAPVPAILDFLPYRQGDLMAARDAAIYPYLAARGLRLRPGGPPRHRQLRGHHR